MVLDHAARRDFGSGDHDAAVCRGAVERHLELLLTMPVTDWDVVLANTWRHFVLFGYAMLAMLCFAVSVSLLGPLDKGAAFAGFAGLYLTTATYMAIGLMASAFTKNQIVAFLLAVTLCLLLWLVGKVVQVMPPAIQPFVDWIGVDGHIGNMARGVFDTRDLLYFLTIIVSCLFVTQTTLEAGGGASHEQATSQSRTAFNAALFVFLSIGALGFANVISLKHFGRIDLTKRQDLHARRCVA